MHGGNGTSGVDWSKAKEIGYSLLLSPLVGFIAAGLLLLVLKFIIRNPALYKEPEGNQPPPWWIRGLLILTCTGVSFAHGSNDGQKGMGLIMLILIGTVPTAYALNRAPDPSQIVEFKASAAAAADVIEKQASGYNVLGDPRPAVESYISTRAINEGTYPSLAALVRDISTQVEGYGTLDKVPAAAVSNVRNDMYLSSEAMRFLLKDKANHLSGGDVLKITAFKKSLDWGHPIHSALGQDRRRHSAWARYHDRLEAHRGDGRREDRQDASDLRAGCFRRIGCDGHHRSCRLCIGLPCFDNVCAVVGCRRNDGG